MDKKIAELEKKIQELEKKINQSNNMFGRSYSSIGNSNQDFLIKTRGQVKVQYGTKTIDLIKNGKVNYEIPKTIFSIDTIDNIGPKDGIYYVEDSKQIILYVSKNSYPISNEQNEKFVSYSSQETTPEEKYQAIINLGLVCETINDIPKIQNGIVYVINENCLYFIKNEIPIKYEFKTEEKFDFKNSSIYENIKLIINNSNEIEFQIGNETIASITNLGLTTSNINIKSLTSDGVSLKNGELTVKKLIETDKSDISNNIIIYSKQAIIEEFNQIDNNIYQIIASNDFNVIGNQVIILTDYTKSIEAEDSTEEDPKYIDVHISEYIGEIIENSESEFNQNELYIKFDNSIDEDLTGRIIYLLKSENQNATIIKENNIYSGKNLLIGYNDLNINDNSSKLASTEWVNKQIPNGIITMINKDSEIPEGWTEYNDIINLKYIIKKWQ